MTFILSSLFFEFLSFRYGTVYKGKWAGATVAVKRYNTFHSSNDTEAQNFYRFRNPYVVGFRGICCSLNALVMEYCPYGSVQSQFGKGTLTEELKELICYDCARGMQVCIFIRNTLLHKFVCYLLRPIFYFLFVQFLHSQDIIHRDLKPDNLLLVSFSTDREDVRAKLSDFGTAKDSLKQTTTTRQTGTPVFMAPEV